MITPVTTQGRIQSLLAASFFGLIALLTSALFSQVNSQPAKILVGAAASLQPVLQELMPPQQVTYTFAASGVLQRQIEQGAPIDLFISASITQMNELERQQLLVPGSKSVLVTNRMVLISPRKSPKPLTDFRQLVRPEIKLIAIAEPRTAPAGQYATEVLQNLDILAQVKSKLVLGNNARATLTAVETGNADAGIVYLTDARRSDQVMIGAIADQKLHAPIIYAIAIVRSTKSLAAAHKYLQFLRSDSAIKVFEQYGFKAKN
ncbi:MAG: molybdate ABC transporter substrate-binding protein [Pseudanabaenaceae cyanobacterium bins.68]|nr:molybdate ABC transporter substrate-binding protein [Pseudanabaenaceae cyanobacterium bins.68]